LQHPSVYCAWPAAAIDRTEETLCARIYFAVNENVLEVDDQQVVETVGTILQYLHTVGHNFDCICRGSADVRGEESYNYRLSEQRAEAVTAVLRRMLPVACTTWLKVEPLGESRSRVDPSFWAEDRRVDIVVRCHPARLNRPSIGFECASDNTCEWVFLGSLTKMEVDRGGCVKTWTRDEIEATYREILDQAKNARSRNSPVIQRLAAMSRDDFIAEMRSRVSAWVRVSYRFQTAGKVHRVSAAVFDTASKRPLFAEEFVEASVLVDGRGTSYLASPEGGATQVWRHLQPGQQPPAGVRTRENTSAAVGLTARPTDLYRRLCGRLPNITRRVEGALRRP